MMDEFDLSLLLTSLSAPAELPQEGAAAAGPAAGPAAAAALQRIQRGEYAAALADTLGHVLPQASHSSTAIQPPADWFAALLAAAQAQLRARGRGGAAAAADADAERLLLLAAVAALYLFTQANLTGPAIALPECPFDLARGAATGPPPPPAGGAAAYGHDTTSAGDRWAGEQLAESGEELAGRVRYPQYLLLAKVLLLDAPAPPPAPPPPPAWSWWALRAALLQQRLLAARSAALRDRLVDLTGRVLAAAAPPEGAPAGGLRRALAAAALLEAAAADTAFGHVVDAKRRLEAAGEALAVTVRLGGALGVRTAHQQDARAQLVVHVARAEGGGGGGGGGQQGGRSAGEAAGVDAAALDAALAGASALPDDMKGLSDESDVLLHPRLHGGGGGAGAVPALSPVEQALLMALCLHVKKGTAADELQPWEMAAYADAVLQQPRGDFVARAAARLQASRVERARPRTRERALLRLEGLAAAMDEEAGLPARLRMRCAASIVLAVPPPCLPPCASPARSQCIARRDSRPRRHRAQLAATATTLHFSANQLPLSTPFRPACPALPCPALPWCRGAFSAWFPLRVALRRELGEGLVATGLVGAALELFEALELWDNLIVCYRLLEKGAAAEALIRARLDSTPGDPRLLCALGDLTMDSAHHEAAWASSKQRSARAARALALAAQRAGTYAAAAARWEQALALNPLHANGWFSLGWCHMKGRDFEAAVRALTRAAQMDPDNGEDWNNLAAAHMQLGRWREARGALGEATRLNRDSWQTWENFASVAARLGEWQAAARGAGAVLALTQGKRVDLEVMGLLVSQVELEAGAGGASGAAAAGGEAAPPECSALAAPSSGAEGVDGETAALAAALGDLSAGGGGGGAEAAAARAEGERQGAERSAATLRQAVGNLLKQAAASAAGDSAAWGLYARFHAATGQPAAAAECLLKRVRALQGGAWMRDPGAFAAYAAAAEALCRCYLASGGAREVGQAGMLLRSATKQAAERYGGHEAFAGLAATLGEVERRQRELKEQP
jgi:hypothetical protein